MKSLSGKFVALTTGCLALFLVGCSGEVVGDSSQAYRNAPRLLLAEDYRFCKADSSPACQLGSTVAVNLAAHGGVLVWTESGPVTRFDTIGTPPVQFGKKGSGPGEYRNVVGVYEESDGRVVLYDMARPGRLVFAADGAPLATHRDAPDAARREMQPVRGGFALLRDPLTETGDSVQSEFQFLQDTIPARTVSTLRTLRVVQSRGFRAMPAFFANTLRWAMEPDLSVLTATGPKLLVTRHLRDGTSVNVVDVPGIGDLPVTAKQLKAERERRAPAQSLPPEIVKMLNAAIADAESRAPRILQFVAALTSLQDGAIMLKELEVQADSVRWTLFSHDGQPLGYIRLPDRADVVDGTRHRILLKTHDAMDVPIIAWYRIGNRR